MSILNPDGYFYISSHDGPDGNPSCDWRDGAPKLYTSRPFDSDKDYYYLEFKDGESFAHNRLRQLTTPQMIRDLRDLDNQTYLILNNSHEAFLSVVDPIYRHVVLGGNIPAEKIILISGSFDIAKEIDRVAEIYGKPPLKAELTLDFEDSACQAYHVFQEDNEWSPPQTLHDGEYKKVFLNFNRRWRLHRPTFVMLLMQYGLLDKGYVSLAPSDCGNNWENSWETIMAMHQDYPAITYIAANRKDDILKIPPLYLDETDLVTNRADIELNRPHNFLYEQTLVSLVSETHFYMSHKGYEPTRFLSEKAWKPILFKHPFIMISTPGILDCLKQIGYKTFDGIIDESYDKIENDGDRMIAIVEETQRIANFTDAERKKFIEDCREICEYNFNVIINKKQFQYKLNYE